MSTNKKKNVGDGVGSQDVVGNQAKSFVVLEGCKCNI
jgi:hypothetical protein